MFRKTFRCPASIFNELLCWAFRDQKEDRPDYLPACKNMLIVIISITFVVIMLVAANAQRELNERGGCPECGFFVPLIRRPKSFSQALWGGWTCEQCGTEMDRRGRELSQP